MLSSQRDNELYSNKISRGIEGKKMDSINRYLLGIMHVRVSLLIDLSLWI